MFYICRINPRATKGFSTREGAFSSSLILPRQLAPKYLTGFISWSILQGVNSALEDKVYLWNRWYTRRSFAPGACPWSMLWEQDPSCVSALTRKKYWGQPRTKWCNFFAFCMGIWCICLIRWYYGVQVYCISVLPWSICVYNIIKQHI